MFRPSGLKTGLEVVGLMDRHWPGHAADGIDDPDVAQVAERDSLPSGDMSGVRAKRMGSWAEAVDMARGPTAAKSSKAVMDLIMMDARAGGTQKDYRFR